MIEEDTSFDCPYCNAPNMIRVEPGAGAKQQFTIDCEICCQPIFIDIRVASGEIVGMDVVCEND